MDIPSIREAFIVASSTVEREWVQRRGRVLRTPPRETVGDRARLPRPAPRPARAWQTPRKGLKKIVQTELEPNVCVRDSTHKTSPALTAYTPNLERLSTAYWPEAGVKTGHPEQRKRTHRRQRDAEREAMVSNFERILDEIRKEAHRTARTYGLEPEAVVKLIMGIVDLEDSYRRKAVRGRINQQVKGMIEDAARVGGTREDA